MGLAYVLIAHGFMALERRNARAKQAKAEAAAAAAKTSEENADAKDGKTKTILKHIAPALIAASVFGQPAAAEVSAAIRAKAIQSVLLHTMGEVPTLVDGKPVIQDQKKGDAHLERWYYSTRLRKPGIHPSELLEPWAPSINKTSREKPDLPLIDKCGLEIWTKSGGMTTRGPNCAAYVELFAKEPKQ